MNDDASSKTDSDAAPPPTLRSDGQPFNLLRELVTLFASLRLTVALFAMAIFLILAGTLAQTEKDIWEVISDYFRTPLARIEFQIFFPPSFFPSRPQVPGWIYFPGGQLIGIGMAINLLSAHLIRFKLQASGSRRGYGLALVALGALLTTVVCLSDGFGSDPATGQPHFAWETLWHVLIGSLVVLWSVGAFGWARLAPHRIAERRLLLGVLAVGAVLLVWLLYQGTLSEASLRIVWQLLQGGLAAAVLLAGCVLLFRGRAGIVLLHAGVGLMMFSELLVSMVAVEGQLHLREGETANYVSDIRTVELAVIDRSKTDADHVVVIPDDYLVQGERVQDDQLPFDLLIRDYLPNASLEPVGSAATNPATHGVGKQRIATPRKASTGTDTESSVDLPAAYVEFFARDSEQSLGVYLLSAELTDGAQQVTIDDGSTPRSYDVALRFRRTYKPYSVHLIDVRKDDYVGTMTPRNYSSDIQLDAPQENIKRQIHIWMNNPLRFGGETFYQSSYYNDPETGAEFSTLQVVSNMGWMIPYVSCMIVAIGMLFHFTRSLLRFLRKPLPTRDVADVPLSARLAPWICLLMAAALTASRLRPAESGPNEFAVHEFGKLPVAFEGRVKTLDTLARNGLRVLSRKQTFVDANGDKQPAIRWLLDLIARPEVAATHRVIYIENLEVQHSLGLERRDGFLYAMEEFEEKIPELQELIEQARNKKPEESTAYDAKLVELEKKLGRQQMLELAWQDPPLPELPAMPGSPEYEQDPQQGEQTIRQFVRSLQQIMTANQRLQRMHIPLVIPLQEPDETAANTSQETKDWQTYFGAVTNAFIGAQLRGQPVPPSVAAWVGMVAAYADDNPADFNRRVSEYQAWVDKLPADLVNNNKSSFEAYFNHANLFSLGLFLYVLIGLLGVLAWLAWQQPLSRSAYALLGFTFLVHTAALVARIYISGRPPVTNLYSSAIFIGWAGVLLCLLFERIYRLGVGTVVGAVLGFSTLFIADRLAVDGDTFVVMQAVLDTQFWLATHVVTISAGYSTTFLAGLFGAFYILVGVLTPRLTPRLGKELTRMLYGTLCFSIFFSFVGTVLGGLWADDSWGRFWGWDPKENGALMIVLWNALVLHARWGGMVRERGLAVLSLGGNIVTSWSWFGVNELGVGLHSYGFTEGVIQALGLFWLSQLALIFMGLLPRSMWWSTRSQASLDPPAGVLPA